ncbi:MAG TPA: DUF547 domain-containing protein [Vicinamibacterales bacterium]|nr:DUF547 domain-containing protein [Vicinamibacterales bacterium]
MRRALVVLILITALAPAAAQQFTPAPGDDPLHRPLDEILDANVRDGLVYYRALKSARGRLDHYTASLNVPPATYAGWSKPQQMAFWVDAYNAFVLETVIDHYPIHGSAQAAPSNSIRQIPGAFEKTTWRAAGRAVTLDAIENTILPEFNEPRLYLALGRGALGSGRLRSEAYTAERLDKQLADIQAEFVTNRLMLSIDRANNTMVVSPIISWHDQAFIAAYQTTDPTFATRSPIERAIVAFILPSLLPLEQEFVQQNRFKVTFGTMDWHLNDLTGRS